MRGTGERKKNNRNYYIKTPKLCMEFKKRKKEKKQEQNNVKRREKENDSTERMWVRQYTIKAHLQTYVNVIQCHNIEYVDSRFVTALLKLNKRTDTQLDSDKWTEFVIVY